MAQLGTPRGTSSGGEFAANTHDEAAPLASGGFDERGRVVKHPADVKPGEIVWDGEEGFVVSEVQTGYVSRSELWTRGKNAEPGVLLRSARGDFWEFSARRDSVVVLRDADALQEHYDDAREW